jgi:hypothetical protein
VPRNENGIPECVIDVVNLGRPQRPEVDSTELGVEAIPGYRGGEVVILPEIVSGCVRSREVLDAARAIGLKGSVPLVMLLLAKGVRSYTVKPRAAQAVSILPEAASKMASEL